MLRRTRLIIPLTIRTIKSRNPVNIPRIVSAMRSIRMNGMSDESFIVVSMLYGVWLCSIVAFILKA